MQPEELKQLIESGLIGAQVTVRGEGDHFEAEIVSAAFEGKGLVQRQRLVYATLGDRMQGEIHALSMRTLTPGEKAEESKFRVSGQ